MPKNNYITENLRSFSLMELKGALRRTMAFIEILDSPSMFDFDRVLVVHKEMASQGLLSRYSDVTPGEGMFRSRSVDSLTEDNIYLGRPGSSFSASVADIRQSSISDELYSRLVNHYKDTLRQDLVRTAASIEKAIEEAKNEKQEVEKVVEKRGLKAKVVGSLVKFYSFIGNEVQFKYPQDAPGTVSEDEKDQQVAYLLRVGLSLAEAVAVANNGLEIAMDTDLNMVDKVGGLQILTEADIIASTESSLRKVVVKAITRSEDGGKLMFNNFLPVIYPNGNTFIGQQQAILRLAMENKGLTIPVVIDKEISERMGITPSGEGLTLPIGSDGHYVKKDFWFLEESDFAEVYPKECESIKAQFRRENSRRAADAERIDKCEALVSLPGNKPIDNGSPLLYCLSDIALRTAFGYCEGVDFSNIGNGLVMNICETDEQTILEQINDGAAFLVHNDVTNPEVCNIIREKGEDVEKYFDFADVINKARSGAVEEESAGIEAAENNESEIEF